MPLQACAAGRCPGCGVDARMVWALRQHTDRIHAGKVYSVAWCWGAITPTGFAPAECHSVGLDAARALRPAPTLVLACAKGCGGRVYFILIDDHHYDDDVVYSMGARI